MIALPGWLVGGALGLGESLLGGASSKKAAAEANKAAEEAAAYQNAQNLLNWIYAKQVRDYEFNENLKIFGKSKEVYQQQLGYNEGAASRSYAAESRKMDEYLQELAFSKQDLFVDMLKNRGAVEARGGSGKSAARLSNSVLSEYGRNNAILAENLVSRTRQHYYDNENIGFQKKNADNEAWSRLMLEPVRPPEPFLPLPVPKGAAGGGSNALLQIGSGVLGAIRGAYSFSK